MTKKKILLVWWYDRLDLISPFLKMQDDIEFTCLFYRFKEQENLNFDLPFKRIYWTDFKSPYEILNQVNPEKVVFFGSGNLLVYSLRFACKIKNAEAIFIAHGIQYKDLDSKIGILDDISNKKNELIGEERYDSNNQSYQKHKNHTFLFFINSFFVVKSLPYVLDFIKLFYYSLIDKNEIRRLIKTKNTFRIFDKYFLFCRNDLHYFTKQDGISEEKVEYIGPYTLDNLFENKFNRTKIERENTTEKYALLIDQTIFNMDTIQKNELIRKISNYSLLNNTKLYIKLHPQAYTNNQYYTDDNIVLIKDNNNIEELIENSIGCYGFYSAMLLPIFLHKKTICFETGISKDLTNEWLTYKLIKLLDSNNFTKEDINFDFYDDSNKMKEEFIYNCLTYTDGKCTERLKQSLLS